MREMLYGRQPVLEALKADRRRLFRLVMLKDARPGPVPGEIRALAGRAGVQPELVKRVEIDRMAGDVNHQGVAAEMSNYRYAEFRALADCLAESEDQALVLILDHIQDPHNVGSLLRTAEAAGVGGVIIPKDRACGVTPAVVRTSAGAAEHVPVAIVANLVNAMKTLKDRGFWFTGLEGVPEAKPYTESDMKGRVGLVIGSEGKGLQRLVRENCDFLVRIPQEGKVTSLNAGVAGAIVLFEALRQVQLERGVRNAECGRRDGGASRTDAG